MRLYPLSPRLVLIVAATLLLEETTANLAFAEGLGGATIPLIGNKDCFGDPLPRHAWGRLGTVRWRHGSFVLSIAFHPDGKTLVSTAEDGSIRVWDAATGRQVRRVEGHRGNVQWVAFDRKGERLAGVVDDPMEPIQRGQLILWDYRTGKTLWSQRVEEALTSVIFSPDAASLATGGSLYKAYLWDAKTGKLRKQFSYDEPKDARKSINFEGVVSFSRDGRLLACAGRDGIGHIWNASSGEKVWGSDVKGSSEVIVFSPDGKLFASRASKDRLILWDVAKRKQIGTIPVSSTIFQFSPDGKILAIGQHPDSDFRTYISFWNVATREKIGIAKWCYPTGRSGTDRISLMAFSPDGKRLAWGSSDHRVHLVDVATGEECQVSREPHGPIESLAYSPDGQMLALAGHSGGGYDQNVYLWSLLPLKIMKTYDAKYPIWSLAFSPDGRTLAVGVGGIQLRDLVTGKSRRLDKDAGSLNWINNLIFSPDGKLLMFADTGETARSWNARTGQELHRFRASANIYALALSPNGRLLAAGDERGSVHVWDLTRNKLIAHFASHAGWIRAAAFSPDGTTLAVGGEGKTIRAWEMASGKPCFQLNCADEVNCLAFSRDGRYLASSGKDKVVSLWALATGKRVARLAGHQGAVTALAFSPDGKTLATASEDTTALLWRWREAIPRVEKHSPLPPRDLQRSWKELAGQDATKAYRAIWILADMHEQALPLIREHVKPTDPPDASLIPRLIANLNSDSYAERNRAMRELETLGELAETPLREAMAKDRYAEVRRRANELIKRLEKPLTDPEKLRSLRALEILEHVNTAESIRMLKELAKGASGARLTREAQAALNRLDKRKE